MKTLNLILQKKWFLMIKDKTKPEEYREMTPYWFSRLMLFMGEKRSQKFWKSQLNFVNNNLTNYGKHLFFNHLDNGWIKFIDFKNIIFTNGYGLERPKIDVKIKKISARIGRKEWGAKTNKLYFTYELGEVSDCLIIKNSIKTVKDIIYVYLRNNNFDGLISVDCKCTLNDLMHFKCKINNCKPFKLENKNE